MDTSKIRKFATEARNVLKRGIEARITTLGFDPGGNVPDHLVPQPIQGGCLWNGGVQTEEFYRQWMALYRRVREKGMREVCEEAAYTWFNRLVAIRILQKNHLCEPVMEYADEVRTPRIVDEARTGRYPRMSEEQRARLVELLDDDTKTSEQFALLVTAFCHADPIISACFGRMEDYTELLLPLNILAEGGFVDMINHTEFLSDEDFRSPELIGWLYQFYISERKDEVFAKKGKVEADEIPAATQIFTPNWIVKYMVQNTLGRIYLDNTPREEDALKGKWQYLVEQSKPTEDENKHLLTQLEQLSVADLACGSGHILGECFDLLYDLYIRQGYSRREAIECIFRHNLTGIDIDTRARQLASFALLLKACQKDSSLADAGCLPNVLDMPPEPYLPQYEDHLEEDLHTIFEGRETPVMIVQLRQALELMRDADSLGSIMKFNLSESTISALRQALEQDAAKPAASLYDNYTFASRSLCLHSLKVILALSTSYSALVMNPPYMGSGKMNKVLSDYVKKNYEEGKADLFSTFMMLAIDRLAPNGKYGMINMHSWMFLSSFEKLRKAILDNYHVENLLHLGPRTFDELSGEVVQNAAFVVGKTAPANGTYYRLVDGRNCTDKERMFLVGEGYYPNVSQQNFEKIPGCPIGYWVSEKFVDIFKTSPRIGDVVDVKTGSTYCPKDKYVRNWHEIAFRKIQIGKTTIDYKSKWYPTTTGERRKWYGNITNIVNYENNGEKVKKEAQTSIRNESFNLREGVSWPDVSSGGICGRYYPRGFLFTDVAPMIFTNDKKEVDFYTALLCSKVVGYIKPLLNPTIHFKPGNVSSLPFRNIKCDSIVSQNISISKADWDAHETSWDFERNELVALSGEADPDEPRRGDLQWLMGAYKRKWEANFMQLHANEEELNRQFIDIYGLQDELTPDVPLSEITILQQGEISVETDE